MIRHIVIGLTIVTLVVGMGGFIQGDTHVRSVNAPEVGAYTQPGWSPPTIQGTVAQLELRSVQAAVMALMEDNYPTSFPPLSTPSYDMSAFPDPITSALAKGLGPLDGDGYVLYGNDETRDGGTDFLQYYMTIRYTMWKYTVDERGYATQHESAILRNPADFVNIQGTP